MCSPWCNIKIIRFRQKHFHKWQIQIMMSSSWEVGLVGEQLCLDCLNCGKIKVLITMNADRARDQLLPDNSTTFEDRFLQFPNARMVYALGGRSLFWNAVTPRPIQCRELNVYYDIAEKLLHTTSSYAKGSSMQNILLKRSSFTNSGWFNAFKCCFGHKVGRSYCKAVRITIYEQ